MVYVEIIENDERPNAVGPLAFILHRDNWNDWGKYRTAFDLHFRSGEGQVTEIGWVKVAHVDISIRERGTRDAYDTIFSAREYEYEVEQIPLVSDSLFSVGQDVEYYRNLKRLAFENDGAHRAHVVSFLKWLGDLAYSYATTPEKADDRLANISADALYESLLRNIELETIKSQYAQIISIFINQRDEAPTKDENYSIYIDLDVLGRGKTLEFTVDSHPSRKNNLHALIGANGLGKTQLLSGIYLKNFDDTVDNENDNKQIITIKRRTLFPPARIPNIIFVSLSAFDVSEPIIVAASRQRKAKNSNEITKHFIGLGKTVQNPNQPRTILPKTPLELRNDLMVALGQVLAGDNRELWFEAVGGTFASAVNPFDRGSSLASTIGEIFLMYPRWLRESEMTPVQVEDDRVQELPQAFVNACQALTSTLSSGHMATLYSLTKLAEVLQNRSVVLLDEPEVHLHPPLLAAYVRGLRAILSRKNAMAIAVTHSPVVLQEVKKECVYHLAYDADRGTLDFTRPPEETYGENVGILTRRVFDLELRDTSFFADIAAAAEESGTYSGALESLGGSLGSEGRVALRSLTENQSAVQVINNSDKFGNPIIDTDG